MIKNKAVSAVSGLAQIKKINCFVVVVSSDTTIIIITTCGWWSMRVQRKWSNIAYVTRRVVPRRDWLPNADEHKKAHLLIAPSILFASSSIQITTPHWLAHITSYGCCLVMHRTIITNDPKNGPSSYREHKHMFPTCMITTPTCMFTTPTCI